MFLELFEWFAKLIGFENINDDLALFCLTLILSVAAFIIAQLWLSHSNHKQDRRNYEYERSKEVNKERFEDELSAAESLSELFMKLRISTHNLRCCPNSLFDFEDARWRKLYNEAAITLGKYAPVLNLRRPSDGAPTCGVHSRKHSASDNTLVDFSAIGDEFKKEWASVFGSPSDRQCSSSMTTPIDCRPSLYLRGIRFLDDCIAVRPDAIEARHSGHIFPDEPLSLFAPEESHYRFLSNEYAPPPGFDPDDPDTRLAVSYKFFVNCAFCRLRNSDTGQRDAQRINKHNARRDRLAKCFPRLRKHSRECPHPTDIDNID